GAELTREAGSETAMEPRVASHPHALGVKWAGCPQPYQERQGSNTKEQESSKHDCPLLGENSDGATALFPGDRQIRGLQAGPRRSDIVSSKPPFRVATSRACLGPLSPPRTSRRPWTP